MRTLEEIREERWEVWHDFMDGNITESLYKQMDQKLYDEITFILSSPTAQLCAAARRLRDEDA